MSRGLGEMQRRILDSLEPSKAFRDTTAHLGADWFDLAVVLEYMGNTDRAFTSSFWRAAGKMVKSGHLVCHGLSSMIIKRANSG